MTMRGIQVSEFGGPDALTVCTDLELPTLGQYDVLIKNYVAGVNFKDLLLCRGDYHGGTPDLPFIPGIEAAGEIAAVGTSVTRWQVGQRVAYMTGSLKSNHNQCYAEYNRIGESGCIAEIPDDISYETGCALVVQGLTMHYLTTDCYAPNAGESVLVHGGGGGLGLLMIARLKSMGATVLTTASRPAKQEAAKAQGADYVIDYSSCDFESAVRDAIPEGVNCVFDGIGKTTFLKGLNCLKRRGTMVLYGNAGGAHPDPIPPTLLTQKGSLVLKRPALYDFVVDQAEYAARLSDLYTWYKKGDINLNRLTVVPLEEVGALHTTLVARDVVGKAVLTI